LETGYCFQKTNILVFIQKSFSLQKTIKKPLITKKKEFTGVPIRQGIDHIHNIEHLSSVHAISVPWFRIHNVSEPILNDNSTVSISFIYSVMNLVKSKLTFTSSAINHNTMTFLSLQNKKSFLAIDIWAYPDWKDHLTHIIYMDYYPNFFVPFLAAYILIEIASFVNVNEDKFFYSQANQILNTLNQCQNIENSFLKIILSGKFFDLQQVH